MPPTLLFSAFFDLSFLAGEDMSFSLEVSREPHCQREFAVRVTREHNFEAVGWETTEFVKRVTSKRAWLKANWMEHERRYKASTDMTTDPFYIPCRVRRA